MQLQSEYRNEIVKLIQSGLSVPVHIYLHGSRAKNTAHLGSDIDIAVQAASHIPIPPFELLRLRGRFSESNIPFFVDIQDLDKMPSWLRDEIQKIRLPL